VAYNVQAVIDAVQQSHHQAADYLLRFFEGRFMPDWLRGSDRRLRQLDDRIQDK
jgi:hypothetical protein